jgi:flagellar hook protein FlgE
LQSGALEGSNVDLSAQLVKLITAQQAYEANVQSINTEQQNFQRLLTIQ